MSKALVYVDSVSKSFGNQIIFKNISFTVKHGETLAIIGHSGCGKTTLLRVIGGFEKAESGKVIVNDEVVIRPSKTSIMIFQDFSQLLPWKTAVENIVWPMIATEAVNDKQEARKIAGQYLSEMGFSIINNDKYPSQLSGGMKQRVSLARALALKPKLLLMDEPFGALDSLTRQKMQIITKTACKKYNTAAILVTHSITEAIRMANNILVFCHDGNTKVIKNNESATAKIEKQLNIKY